MKSSQILMDSMQVTLRSAALPSAVRPASVVTGVGVVRGRPAILARHTMLEALCERTGQAGAMRWLEFDMGKPTEAKKIPTLLLIGLNANVSTAEATADDVQGAVMLYEYKLAGRGLKLFATDNMNGRGTVIAPAARRIQIAEEACARLMGQGALAALITLDPGTGYAQPKLVRERPAAFAMARQVRSVALGPPLGRTFEETLAALGKRTRRNLRYYRKRLESDLGSEFVSQVEMSRDDFLKFNRCSMNPATEAWAQWRYDSGHNLSGMMFAGMRGRDGQWLSLIGGRRHGATVEIDWQMNVMGLLRCSLCTAMRSYILEHAVKLGMTQMIFTGGTAHSMGHSFACVDAMDVVAVRRSAAGGMLRRMARWMPGNFLAQTLCDEQLHWE